MSYTTINSNYSNTTWFKLIRPEEATQVLDASFEQLDTFSPTTNWEKVFELGDKINQELKMSQKDIVNEVIAYRKKSKC